ncbi:MAG: LysE family transporter, partial [Flavobacteriaceae bacterium]|nr:LysE family transporter [Flavobacteriaceae bacterium]
MTYIFHIFLGFIMGYFGLITPGMLNMTSVKYSIEKGMRQALIFSAGAAGIVFIQAMIALGFTDYLVRHPEIIANLKIAGIIVFVLLSVFFFIQSKKNLQIKNNKTKSKPFITGIFMSSINMLAIPFYLALSAFLNARG